MKSSGGRTLGLCLLLAWSATAGDPCRADPVTSDARLVEARVLVRATEYGAALQRIEAVLAHSRQQRNRRREAEAMLIMGLALGESGAWQRGLEWCRDAQALFHALGLPRQEGWARLSLARALQAVGDKPAAGRELLSAEAAFARLGDPLGLAAVQAQRSLLALRAGQLQQAIDEGTQALAQLRRIEQDDDVVVATVGALSAVAYARHQLGQLALALADYERLLALAWQVNDQRQIHFAYCNRAEIRWQMGEARPAEEDLRRAIAGWESSRARIRGAADQRAEFLGGQVAAYDRLIRYLFDTSRGEEAFAIAERFHARSLLETLADPPLPALGAAAPALWAERQKSVDELGRLRLVPGERGEAWRQRLTEAENRLQAIETRLSARRRPSGTVTEPPTAEQIRAGLEPGEALVAYWLTEEQLFAWIVVGDGVDVVQVPVPSARLEAALATYLEPMRSPRRAEDAALRHLEPAHLETGQLLYRWLIGSLPPKARAARRLILVPDGALHNLPFESLISSCKLTSGTEIHAPYRACSFLGLEKPILYTSSAGVFLSLRERQRERAAPAARSLLALAPEFGSLASVEVAAELRQSLRGRAPLLHARDEVRRIGSLVAGANLRLEEQASERRFKREAGSYRLLHLATHGLVNDELPLSSGLLLAGGGGEDGLLQAHEVLGLELTADLVTLSACRSGRGALRRGEGVIGLSRAFLTAGASSVVVSLWDVDDRSTPILMEELYRQVAAGVAAPEAMLAARRRLFNENGEARLVFNRRPLAWAHPRFWASFVVVGTV